MNETLTKWNERAESFARIRAQIRQVLASSDKALDMAEIYPLFKERFRFLPDIERRMRELVKSGDVKKNGGAIPTYELCEVPEAK